MKRFILLLCILISACNQKKTLFKLLPASQTGLSFNNKIIENDSLNVLSFEYIFNGAGVAVGDFNNDGFLDIFFGGSQVSSKLFLNKKGKGIDFQDVTEIAGVKTQSWCTGVSVVDINADGKLDIYVSTIHPRRDRSAPNLLFINQGNNANGVPLFKEMAAEIGLADTGYSTHTVFFDYDNDQDLDCYILTNALENYNRNNFIGQLSNGAGKSTDRLYRNEGIAKNGLPRFNNVSKEAGIQTEGWGLGVGVVDFNEDGWLDIYVCNDFQSNDLLWENQKDGTFKNKIKDYLQHQSHNSMGLDIADINNDTRPDIVTLDMMPDNNRRIKSMFGPTSYDRYEMALLRNYQPQFVRNMLQLNNGKLPNGQVTFSEIGQLSGVFATDWSWAPLFADFDNDGWRDLLITNGYHKDVTDLDFIDYNQEEAMFADPNKLRRERAEKMAALLGVKISNYLFKNKGDLTFEDVTEKWGMKIPSYSNGAAYADFDNDGDLDVVINNINDEAFFYLNTLKDDNKKQENNYLRISLKGSNLNRQSIGAKVEIRYQNQKQAIQHSLYRGYKSCVEPDIHFGLGAVNQIDSLWIKWPDGKAQLITQIKANQTLEIDYKHARFNNSLIINTINPLFQDITQDSIISFHHQENHNIDFKTQILVPHSLSAEGPCIAVGDVDKNGLEDFYLGASSSFKGVLYLQKSEGKFKPQYFPEAKADQTAAVFFDIDNDQDLDLYVANGGNEYLPTNQFYQDLLFINDGKGNFVEDKEALPDTKGSGSCIKLIDFDQDGDQDLFIGGRVLPKKYPLAGKSYLLKNESIKGGRCKLVDVTEQIAPSLSEIGMVKDAIFADYDNDHDQDLILVGEFMPITIFKNQHKAFKQKVELKDSNGWWNCVQVADIDQDGDLDLVGGNLGLNSRFKAHKDEPICIFVKDYDNNGYIDPVLCYYIQHQLFPYHPRNSLAEQIPIWKKRFTSYAQYGSLTWDKILTPADKLGIQEYKAYHLTSSVFKNLGNDQFELIPLPQRAQVAPIQDISIEDFDNDGILDLILAGNDFTTEVQVGRYDAMGLVLFKGQKNGQFTFIEPAHSGLWSRDDVRFFQKITLGKNPIWLLGANSAPIRIFRKLTK
jgi:hypothetical protein